MLKYNLLKIYINYNYLVHEICLLLVDAHITTVFASRHLCFRHDKNFALHVEANECTLGEAAGGGDGAEGTAAVEGDA